MQSYMIASNISLHLLSLSLSIYTFPGFLKMALSRLSLWLNLVPQVMIHSNYAWAPATGEASVQDSCFKEFDVCRRHAGGHEVQSCPIWCFNLASVLVDEQRQCLVSRLEADSLLSFLTAIVSCSAARNCHVCFQGLRAGSLTLWSTPMTRRADWGSVSQCSVLTNAQHCWQAEKCVCFVSSPNPKHSAGGAQCGEHFTTWEASKITFHADRNCMLDNRTLANWTGKGELCQTLPFPLPWPPWPFHAIPMQMSSRRAKFGCRSFCNSLGFGLRQVGLLHARQAHGWSWTLQLQHELWLQLFDVLCVISFRGSQCFERVMNCPALPRSAWSVTGTTGRISLAADLDKSKRMANGTPRIQAISVAQELRFVRKHCLKYRLFSNWLNQVWWLLLGMMRALRLLGQQVNKTIHAMALS